jgi:hypothetical protein
MLLDKFFVNLRTGTPDRFFASKVLNLYGRLFIGGPSVDEIQGPDKSVRQQQADTYFYMPVDRTPAKRNENHEISALWTENLRQEEHPQVGRAVAIATTLLCTALFSLGGVAKGAGEKWDHWNGQRKAANALEEAREYAAKRDGLKKEWADDIASYSAQKCLDEVSALRDRKTDEARDRYAVLEAGCADKRSEIKTIAQSWSLDQCAAFGKAGTQQIKAGGSQTWLDGLVFQEVCSMKYGADLSARLK